MYFVCFAQGSYNGFLLMNEVLDDEHPLEWLARTQAENPKALRRLVSWQKLTDEEAAFATQIASDPKDYLDFLGVR